ncbi:MAG: TonB-dependent receptor [Bacteroidia bacterium]|nr:TonB-dependent receptor [Bacteroidia bacterium]
MYNYKLLVFLLISGAAIAQNDISNDITVVKGYKPILAEGVKISPMPTADTASIAVPKLTYHIQPQSLASAYQITPIKAVKIKEDNIRKLYRGYVEAGIGIQGSFYGDLYYNALRSKTFNAGIHAKHFSSAGKINDYGFPGNSLNLIETFGEKYLEHGTIGAKFGYQRNVFHYYGYDAEQTVIAKSETRHVFNDISGSVDYKSLLLSSENLKPNVGIDFHHFADNLNSSESRFGLRSFWQKQIASGSADVTLNFAFTKYKQPLRNFNRSRFTLTPTYTFSYLPWTFKLGFNTEMEGETETKFRLYPYARFDYALLDKVTVFGELSGKVADNNFKSISTDNPFLEDTISVLNTNQLRNIKFGVHARIDNQFTFNAYVNFAKQKNALFYANRFTAFQPVTFIPVYTAASLTAVHAELGFENSTKLNVWLKADYLGYSKFDTSTIKSWHVSPFMFTLALNYNLSDKIMVKTDVFIRSESERIKYDAGGAFAGAEKIKPWADVNLSASYRYSKVLSFYVNLNNVAFVRYQQWYNYPAYRFNAMAGITYAFR